VTDDLRDRIVRLWDLVELPDLTPGQRGDIADAFLHAIHQPAIDRLRAELSSAEETAADREQNAMHWQERAEEAEAAVARVRKLADELIDGGANWDGNEPAAGLDILAALDQGHDDLDPREENADV
jgi:hypothetical protein